MHSEVPPFALVSSAAHGITLSVFLEFVQLC